MLVTDFEEGMSIPEMLAEIRMLADSGAKLLGLAALDDDAKPRYHTGNRGRRGVGWNAGGGREPRTACAVGWATRFAERRS